MTNNINNNGKNSHNVVLARFQGEEARKIIAELEAGHGLRFNVVKDEEDGNNPPVVELIKDV